MISYLKGQIVHARPNFIILCVNGVGYKVFTNQEIDSKLSKEIEMFVYENIREDADDLYGFLTYEELELFERLISVNGVGPKAGLNIMSSANSDRIIQAILSDDLGFFTSISGIGKKVSAKIILDLKSKFSNDKTINVISQIEGADDLMEAMESLGYKKVEMQGLITKIPPDIDSLEEKVRWCLQRMSK